MLPVEILTNQQTFHKLLSIHSQCSQKTIMTTEKDRFHNKSPKYFLNKKQNFLVLFRLYEVCNRFGKLDDNQNKRRLYCKKKFIEIMKQVKTLGSTTSKA